ncbi:MAG: hypothetical protein ACRENL_11425 [Candidatus Dormibacteria bacterium]
MSLSAVQLWLKGQLTGTAGPDFGPTQVEVAPPQSLPLDNPALYIWGSRFRESRRTLGRPSAKKKVDYDVYLWLKAQFPAGDPREDVAFPLLMETIMATLRTGPGINTPIVDPDTLTTSYLMEVGEEFQVDYPGPTDIENESYRLYEAQIIVTCEEDRTG